MGGGRALLVVALAVAAAALLAAPAAAKGNSKATKAAVANICKGTAFPQLCKKTATSHAHHYSRVDPRTVLKMQLDAFHLRVGAAQKRAKSKVAKAPPEVGMALHLCSTFYQDAADNIGACRRAIGFKDAVTVRATMDMAVQDMQNCDEQFRQVAAKKNPLEKHNKSLGQMAENCRSLSNMI